LNTRSVRYCSGGHLLQSCVLRYKSVPLSSVCAISVYISSGIAVGWQTSAVDTFTLRKVQFILKISKQRALVIRVRTHHYFTVTLVRMYRDRLLYNELFCTIHVVRIFQKIRFSFHNCPLSFILVCMYSAKFLLRFRTYSGAYPNSSAYSTCK